jgi:hypothetical protein
LELDLVVAGSGVDPFIVVMHSHREDLFSLLLADDILIEKVVQIFGLWHQRLRGVVVLPLVFLCDDIVAKLHAFVADVHRGASDELTDLFL